MIPGKAYTRNCASSDGDYVYFMDEDQFKYKKLTSNWDTNEFSSVTGRFPSTVISIMNQDLVRSNVDLKIGSTNLRNQSSIILPFRFPAFMRRGNIFMSDDKLVEYNPDFSIGDVANNNGYMIELFMNQDHIKKYISEYHKFWNSRTLYGAYLPIESQRLTSPQVGLLHMYAKGFPGVDHYPTSLSLQSQKSGGINYVYVVYVYNCRIRTKFIEFWTGRNTFDSLESGHKERWDFPQDWYNINFNAAIKGWNKRGIEFRWSVPVVTRWKYDGLGFTFKDLSSPYGVYANKINSSIGTNQSWNTKLIPYDTTQMGNIGSLNIPSANRCVANSYLDKDNNRLVTVTAYGSEENTWPNDFRVDISYHTTGTALTFIPAKQATYAIKSKLARTGQFGRINNINSIDITKWQNYYILAVSYDLKYKDKDVRFGTLLLKVNSAPADPTIDWFKNIKGACFGGVQGLSSGSML